MGAHSVIDHGHPVDVDRGHTVDHVGRHELDDAATMLLSIPAQPLLSIPAQPRPHWSGPIPVGSPRSGQRPTGSHPSGPLPSSPNHRGADPARAWSDLPPAGLDGPLVVPPRSTARIVSLTAAGVGATAVVVAGMAALSVAAFGGSTLPTPSVTPSTGSSSGASSTSPAASSRGAGIPASAAAQRCASTVATDIDSTVTEFRSTSPTRWNATIDAHRRRITSTYGAGSPEYTAYTNGTRDIMSWLTDRADTRSYDAVIDHVVPQVLATCSSRA